MTRPFDTRRRTAGVIAALAVAVWTMPATAKNDIRGVKTAQPLADGLETLEWDGATCAPVVSGQPVVCTYDQRTRMTLYAGRLPPNNIEKLVYTFYYDDLNRMRVKLQQLFGLRRDRIEGDHKLFTGERLDIELNSGSGTLTITNDAQAQKDRVSEAR